MSLIRKTLSEQEIGVSHYFPITHLVTPSIFETRDGLLGAVLKVKGIPFVTITNDTLNHYQRLFHQTLLMLNHEYVLYETRIRQKRDITLSGEFDEPFASIVNNKYFKRFEHAGLYTNSIYLTLLYKNELNAHDKQRFMDKALAFGKSLSKAHCMSNRAFAREKGIKKLTHKVSEIQSLLSEFGVTILGADDEKLGFSELLHFLSIIPNGGKACRLSSSINPSPTTHNLLEQINVISKYPKGHLGQYLCNHRLFFGDNIQFQGNTESDNHFATMLSLKQYGPSTANVILDPLLNIDGEYIFTQSFAPIERDLAIKEIKRAHAIKSNADDLSHSQIAELGTLADFVASEKVHCGFHHNTLMLIHESQESLDALVNDATKAYGLSNMSLVRETIAQQPAFFSQIPGNGQYIARSAMITSENFADFCALHNTQTGHNKENFLPSSITLLETPSKTPVFFNYHAKGSKTNPSRGHTLVIGGNDSGKTTLVSFLDCQMARYRGHRSVFLDRNSGLKIYISAMNGRYITIAPTHKQQCMMNPLKLSDTSMNRDFVKAWFQALLLNEGEASLPGRLTEITNDAIDYCFDALDVNSRTLSHVAKFIPKDFPRWAELKRWLRGSDDSNDGQYAWVFDNEDDAITLDAKRIGFDITYVLDNFKDVIATPLFMYIMHRIELCLDGNLTSIVIDEMWQVLRTPYWRTWLEQRLPSIRKDCGHIVGMTQSPKTIVDSPICSELLDNVATMILFPNPKAEPAIYIDRLGLSASEFDFIKNNSPQSRLFLYKHDTESIICKLDLSDLTDEIRVFSGNKASVVLMEKLTQELGQNPTTWLPEFIKRSQRCSS